MGVSGFTMLDTSVSIRTMKLSNSGPGYCLDGRPSREFQVLLATHPPPSPPCRQSTVLPDSLCLNQVIETRTNKKKQLWGRYYKILYSRNKFRVVFKIKCLSLSVTSTLALYVQAKMRANPKEMSSVRESTRVGSNQ